MQPVNLTSEFLVLVLTLLACSFALSPNVRGNTVDFEKLQNAEWVGSKQGSVISDVKKNKATILQFWASWCAGCGENMVALSKIQAHYDKLGIKVGFFPVSIDDSKKEALKYFEIKKDLSSYLETSIWDKQMVFTNASKVTTVPYFIVVDRSGNVKKTFAGHLGESAILETKKAIEECFHSGSALKIIKEDK